MDVSKQFIICLNREQPISYITCLSLCVCVLCMYLYSYMYAVTKEYTEYVTKHSR